MPQQKPNVSEQTVCTPKEFLTAIESLYGPIDFDLAANSENAVAPAFFGPGSFLGEDSLVIDWPIDRGLMFLNPPFGLIKGPNGFAQKACVQSSNKLCRIAMLIPAAVSTNWFADYVNNYCLVRPIRPRLTFVNHVNSYPKDLMLCLYNVDGIGFDPWKWK